jgi:signal transduction histidine kinase
LISAVAGPKEVIVRVEDNGPGIPADIQPRIFEPFFSTKPSSGIGLGLGVVRKLVALYEGRISVESVVGHGTCFTIVLPSAPPPRLEAGEQEIAS